MTTSSQPTTAKGWNFDNSYARLPNDFFRPVHPVPVASPSMVVFHSKLAAEVGLEVDDPDVMTLLLAGNAIPPGAEPIAQAYAGHQFGHLTMLGDGRAILLGEQITPKGKRVDLQLKGSGRTPFSRRGDGRAALGPMLREYIISEAIHALGLPTTRSLAVVTTGEPVQREQPLHGAILTRLAASHIRVGTFEYAARVGDREQLEGFADYTLKRHYPELADSPDRFLLFLEAVVQRQASLVAGWMLHGFVHGVMNTDNMAISGETIDYGPCAFLDSYHPSTVFSSIDYHGRYAFGQQPQIASWNLARFAETLVPILHQDSKKAVSAAEEILANFSGIFQKHWLAGMRKKLGFFSDGENDLSLIERLLEWMVKSEADYTNTFLALEPGKRPEEEIYACSDFQDWYSVWQGRLKEQPQTAEEVMELLCRSNPAVIPRNHKVEEALEAAELQADLRPFHRLLEAVSHPYDREAVDPAFQTGPPPGSPPYQTFCGT